MSHVRWWIVFILFLATVINYVDRNVLSFTMIDDGFRKTMLGLPPEHVLTSEDVSRFAEKMGYVDWAFKTAYAIGFLCIGYWIDRLGTKRGLGLGMLIWSLAGCLAAFASGIASLAGLRFLLGLGEASIFPSSVKTVSEWFPKRERTMAVGTFNAGTNIGVIATAFLVPILTIQFGWRASFLITGLMGFGMLALWWWSYSRPESNRRVSSQELAHIRSDGEEEPPGEPIRWLQLLQYRQTWALMTGKFLADPIWWFYLTWLPSFFNDHKILETKLDLKTIGIPFLVIYLVSDFGSIFFGWLSTYWMNRGWSMTRARKTTMLICALCVLPIYFAATTTNIYIAVALIALATAAHQGWSANMYPFGSDLFPKNYVASVSGIGGTAGAIGGMIMAPVAGLVIARFSYTPIFIWASCAYLIAWIAITLILPKLVPIDPPNSVSGR
ncbi:MAG: MFS transporter [Pirellulales bacterium]